MQFVSVGTSGGNSGQGGDVRGCFYSGTDENPIYVDYIAPSKKIPKKWPIVMLHGAFHTGAAYLTTPDGRQGWAPDFAARGYPVYVVDWPGHGRSPANAGFANLTTFEIASSVSVLVDQIGPAIILAHSAGGPVAWWLAENLPDKVAAVVGIAPGPPANIQTLLPDDPVIIDALKFDQSKGCPVYSRVGETVYVDLNFIQSFWANGPRFPKGAVKEYAKSIVGESAKVLNERFNIGTGGLKLSAPEVVAGRPILIVTGDCDLRHPKEVDGAVASYLHAETLWLADVGIIGNGHMLMIEDNSDEIAALIAAWLSKKGL